MSGFRVFMKPGGWRVTDGTDEFGPYPTYHQAVTAAQNLNHQHRAAEERSFAPHGGGLSPTARSAEAPVAPEFREPARDGAHLVGGEGEKVKVLHGRPPEAELPAQMVSETGGGVADRPIGDVLEYPDNGSVWEALEAPPEGVRIDEERAAREAIERAAVRGADGPAEGSASRGGGLV